MGLICEGIQYRYTGSEFDLFDGLSFELNEPGFNALFGPSGVGKTTLARMITGDITGYTGRIDAAGLQGRLYSYNLERLPGWSSVGKHIDKITPAERKGLRDELIATFGIEPCMGLRYSELSLGQQNRVNLLRYLLQDFQLLIMDESLANVTNAFL